MLLQLSQKSIKCLPQTQQASTESKTGLRSHFIFTDACSKSIIIPCHVTKEKNEIYFHEIPCRNQLH